MPGTVLGLFEGYGAELEYAIADRETGAVVPIADRLIEAAAGETGSEIERGRLCWSNELVMHVIELKTNGPAGSLAGLAPVFQAHVDEINGFLRPMGARLMPTAMHPFMDPDRDTKLWTHEYNEIYETYNRIFDCRGHGWSNLQSIHLNLPFKDDGEFARLHAAIRALMPILPALAASSPAAEGRLTGLMDARMEYYRHNSARVPSVSGRVIPENARSEAEYRETILEPMYREIRPHDPEGILQHEWLNARGAIARFERNTIEIRVLDIQECPAADLAVLWAVSETLRALCGERWSGPDEQMAPETGALEALFLDAIRRAGAAEIQDAAYLALFGANGASSMRAGDLWNHIFQRALVDAPGAEEHRPALETILRQGSLAERIVRRLPAEPSRDGIAAVYDELCDCLAAGRLFLAEPVTRS